VLWGSDGVVLLLATGLVFASFSPYLSPHLIMRLYRARPLSASQAPTLYALLVRLAERAGLDVVPTLYYLPTGMVNAFAVGRPEEASICVTDGLLRALDTREAAGVLAHEICHIRNNDMRVMGLADMFTRLTGTLSMLGQFLLLLNLPLILLSATHVNWLAVLLLIVAPNINTLAQLGLSRTREFDADLNAARLTGDPEGLAQALVKIERIQAGWLQRLFFPGRGIPEPSMLRTHPPTDERVRRLLELRTPEAWPAQLGLPDLDAVGLHFTAPRVARRPRWHFSGVWH
jgi:heat shock protein HtpX